MSARITNKQIKNIYTLQNKEGIHVFQALMEMNHLEIIGLSTLLQHFKKDIYTSAQQIHQLATYMSAKLIIQCNRISRQGGKIYRNIIQFYIFKID